MSKIIVMLGAPGAGKGTQARLLVEKFGYPQIATGDILRQMAKADTPLGREIRDTQAAGKLVADEVLADVVRDRTARADCAGGYILDGFPRTLKQAELLEKLAERQGNEIVVIRVAVLQEAMMKRLTGRRTCGSCGEIFNVHHRAPQLAGVCDVCGAPLTHRSDDNEEAVGKRLAAYKQATAPLIEYYERSGRLVMINGERPVEEVFSQLSAVIAG